MEINHGDMITGAPAEKSHIRENRKESQSTLPFDSELFSLKDNVLVLHRTSLKVNLGSQ